MVLVLSMMLKTCMSAFENIFFLFNLVFCGIETINFLHIAANLFRQLKQNILAICFLRKKILKRVDFICEDNIIID